jgi:hypothetical protein
MASQKMTMTIRVEGLEPVKEFYGAVREISEWLSWHETRRYWPEELRGEEPQVSPEKLRKVVNMLSGEKDPSSDEEGASALPGMSCAS